MLSPVDTVTSSFHPNGDQSCGKQHSNNVSACMVKCVMILWSCLNQLGRISQLVKSACVTSAPHSSSLTGYKHMVLSISSITETKKLPRACWLECKTLVWPDGHGKIRSSLCCLEGGNVTSGRWCHFSVLETKRTHFAGLFFFLLNLCLFCSWGFFYFSRVARETIQCVPHLSCDSPASTT